MKRYELINWFVQKRGYRRYLEIGIDKPQNCFDRVRCEEKTGVDPNVGVTAPPVHYRITSDAFFEQNTRPFDIVFVDGLHICDQAVRDADNALRCLAPGGTIIMHDCRPYNEHVAGPDRQPGYSWYGTVWKAWATLRATRPDLEMHVVTDDCGLGVIRRGSQMLYAGPYDTYTDWARHQDEIIAALRPGEALTHYARTQ
jgi:SAM-dependent methyltransferase